MQTRALPRDPEDSQNRSPGRMILLLPLLSQDAAWLWMCVCPSPTQQQLAETLCRQLLIVNCRTTDEKFQIFEARTSFVVPRLDSRWATAPYRHSNTAVCSRHRIQPQRPTNVCKIPSAQMENTKSRSPSAEGHPSRGQSSQTLQLEKNGLLPVSETGLSTIGPDLTEVTVTRRQTQEQTPPHHKTTDKMLPLSPVNRPHHCSTQASSCALGLRALSLMFQGDLEQDVLFEDHGVCSGVIADFLALERTVYPRCAPGHHQPYSWPTGGKVLTT